MKCWIKERSLLFPLRKNMYFKTSCIRNYFYHISLFVSVTNEFPRNLKNFRHFKNNNLKFYFYLSPIGNPMLR